jgi:hypothetical protein
MMLCVYGSLRSRVGHAILADMSEQKHTPISHRAAMGRIQRRLAPHGRKLVEARGALAREQLGGFYVLDATGVVAHHVDVESFARELGALAAYERIA